MNKLFLFIFALMFTTAISSQDYAVFRLGSTDASALSVGDMVYVPVYCDDISSNSFIGLQLMFSFDHAVLTWNGTNPNPLPGVINFNPIFPYSPADWFFNDNGSQMVVLWNDPTFTGVSLIPEDLLFEFVFTYSGGETQLIFDFFDLLPGFAYYLIDGCVCSSSITYPAIFHISCNNTILEDAEVIINSISQFSDSLGITIFNLTSGEYSYSVQKPDYETETGSFTISDMSQVIEVDLENIVNIEENSFSDFNVFPNPSNGMFYFETEVFKTIPVEIRITDLTGKLIFSGNFTNNSKISLNLSEQPEGIYLAKIKSDTIIFYKKLLVR